VRAGAECVINSTTNGHWGAAVRWGVAVRNGEKMKSGFRTTTEVHPSIPIVASQQEVVLIDRLENIIIKTIARV
jgi:hypothetical protein